MLPADFVELGKRYVALGRAIQDHDTPILELCGLAFDCGLSLEFRLQPREPVTPETVTAAPGKSD